MFGYRKIKLNFLFSPGAASLVCFSLVRFSEFSLVCFAVAPLPPPVATFDKASHEKRMKQSKDPFEAALEEQEESPPESPIGQEELEGTQSHTAGGGLEDEFETSNAAAVPGGSNVKANVAVAKNKEDDEEEEEENMDVDLASKLPSSADPSKMEKMQSILSQFTEDQMNRYESFRRSALQKANMRRLLVSITGSQKISLPMTITVCGIAKMFVGELVETARMVMTERRESGPIRPCHIREAYRRLKLEGKVPKRSVPRLFR
ncbi:hypothetical protein ACOSP7_013429 [Xanthoceras sorbifolium]